MRALVSATTAGIVMVAYVVYAGVAGLFGSADLRRVAVAMLITMGVMVVVIVAAQIVFHILFGIRSTIGEGARLAASGVPRAQVRSVIGETADGRIKRLLASSAADDEMSRLIAMKARRAAMFGAGAGFIAALVVLTAGGLPATAIHVQFCSFALGVLLADGLTIRYNQRGVSHA